MRSSKPARCRRVHFASSIAHRQLHVEHQPLIVFIASIAMRFTAIALCASAASSLNLGLVFPTSVVRCRVSPRVRAVLARTRSLSVFLRIAACCRASPRARRSAPNRPDTSPPSFPFRRSTRPRTASSSRRRPARSSPRRISTRPRSRSSSCVAMRARSKGRGTRTHSQYPPQTVPFVATSGDLGLTSILATDSFLYYTFTSAPNSSCADNGADAASRAPASVRGCPSAGTLARVPLAANGTIVGPPQTLVGGNLTKAGTPCSQFTFLGVSRGRDICALRAALCALFLGLTQPPAHPPAPFPPDRRRHARR